MPGCAAANCCNSSRHKIYKFYKFPADPKRREIWINNSGRTNWTPTRNSVLCNVHFEDIQFEMKRLDGRKLLGPYAIPTIFNIPKIVQIDTPKTNVKSEILENVGSTEENKCIGCESLDYEIQSFLSQMVTLERELELKGRLILNAKQEVAKLQQQICEKNSNIILGSN